MSLVMPLILRPCAGDEVVEGKHLGRHVGHLGVDNSDRFFMDRAGCGLDAGVVFVDGAPIILHLCLQGLSGLKDLVDQEGFFLRPNVHT